MLESTVIIVLNVNHRAPLYVQVTIDLQTIVHQVSCQDFQQLLRNLFTVSPVWRQCSSCQLQELQQQRSTLMTRFQEDP